MRSCWSSKGRPAHGRHESDRGCPLGTVVDPLIWHASGTGEVRANRAWRQRRAPARLQGEAYPIHNGPLLAALEDLSAVVGAPIFRNV